MVHKGFTTQGKKRNIFVEDVMVAKGYGHIQIGCASFKKIKARSARNERQSPELQLYLDTEVLDNKMILLVIGQ